MENRVKRNKTQNFGIKSRKTVNIKREKFSSLIISCEQSVNVLLLKLNQHKHILFNTSIYILKNIFNKKYEIF